jgi:polar amino acid transport system substrate-binding protein
MLKQAKPEFAETLDAAVDLLRTGQADVMASVRETLPQHSARLAGSRVVADGYEVSFLAIAIPKGQAGRLAYVSEFLEEAKESGLVQRAIDRAGLRGFQVATPQEPS